MTESTTFELLQPVEYRGSKGYITFISEYYISICFIDIPLPESENSRWGRHYVNFIVYPNYWNEIRCRLDEVEKEGHEESPRSDLLQYGRCCALGTTHQHDATRKN
tara:strand:+ start:1381 stop:1698 length:318 start_codon:yes stop_codon:yes gene_type:complete